MRTRKECGTGSAMLAKPLTGLFRRKKKIKTYGWCNSFTQSTTPFLDSNEHFPLTFSLTFSKEEGETTEKQTKKTSVCG